jgi:hypothetical protein
MPGFDRTRCQPILIMHNHRMTVKERVIETIRDMPDDTTWETIQDRINFVVSVRKDLPLPALTFDRHYMLPIFQKLDL